MGEKGYYDEYHRDNPGSFFFWPGVVEISGLQEEERYERRYQMYLTRYKGDEERARMIMEIESELTVNYNGLTYIGWKELPFPDHEKRAQAMAAEKGWSYHKLEGANTLLKQLVDGDWQDDRFQMVRPGHTAAPSYDNEIIKEV